MAMIPMPPSGDETLLNRSLKDGVNLPELVEELAIHYLKRALDEAHGNKTKAAQLVGLPIYQTFSSWIKKYNLG